VDQYCQIGNFQSGTFAPMHGIGKWFNKKLSYHYVSAKLVKLFMT
jgi:hypothetical protein